MDESDRILLRDLESCSLPAGGFAHREHVRAAWAMLRLEPAARAIPRFRACLERLARHHGAPGRYHETITLAFLFAINERLQRLAPDHGWPEFAAAHPGLLADGEGFLATYFSRARLDSELARHHFLLPDRAGAGADGGNHE